MKKIVNLVQFVVLLCLLSLVSFAQVNTDKTPPAPQPPGGYPFLVERDEKMTVTEYKERIFGALDLIAAQQNFPIK